MMRNYLPSGHFIKMAWRNVVKSKVYTSINIVGLAIGIAASLLIFLVIHYELSYDAQQSRGDRIYRVVSSYINRSNGEAVGHEGSVPILLPDAMRTDFPEFEKAAAVWNIGGAQIHVLGKKGIEDEKIYKQNDGLFFTDRDLFDIYDYEWLAGNAKQLTQPNTVVLAQSVADNFFGNWKNAIGKTIQLWSFRVPLQVTGVFKDLPANTDLQVKMGASYATFRRINSDFFEHADWSGAPWSSEFFVLLSKARNIKAVEARLPAFVKKYYPADRVNGATITSLSFQPLKNMHLDERFSTFKGDALTHKELWALGLIGVFLLLVGCINFINLATSQSVNRAKEIGVRKVLGSNRGQILKQFLNETALLTFISLVLGCIIAQLSLPFLSNLMQKPLSLDLWHHPSVLLFLVLTGITVTILSGLYPGVILSRFNPIEAIKSKITAKIAGGISLRKGLVVSQFVIAQLLIIGTLVVIRQMQFFRNQSMGFDKNAVALVELPSDSTDRTRYDYLKSEVLKIPGIQSASFCMDAPAAYGSYNTEFYVGDDPVKKDFNITVQLADTDYLKTFRIALINGRLPYKSDTVRELLINEKLVAKLGLRSPAEALGKTIAFYKNGTRFPVVGVMHDFNNKSLREEVPPLAMSTNVNSYNFISFRMEPDKMGAALEQVHAVFTRTFPFYLYDLTFVDERVERFYHSELVTSQLFKIFAFLAILISCLGLYGLVSFMAVQKTKEVGVRKVLGASVKSIVYLFSKEFTILIAIAFLISAPIGYYFMKQWLSGFYYHINMGWGVFALTIALSMIIAWITVGYKALKAAVANPVKSLRTE